MSEENKLPGDYIDEMIRGAEMYKKGLKLKVAELTDDLYMNAAEMKAYCQAIDDVMKIIDGPDTYIG